MGRALAAGIIAGAPHLREALRVSDAVPAAVAAAVDDVGGRPATVAEAGSADVVLVAVKPGDMANALKALAPSLAPEAVVVSVAAGWGLQRLGAALPGVALVRLMPNLAVRHWAGVVAVAYGTLADRARDGVARLLAPLGAVVELPEGLFPVATALAGSGPGLVALVAEALEEGAVAAGLGRAQAREMVAAVLAGTAALLGDGGDPAELRRRVSSPGGTTLAGLQVLERAAVRASLADAVRAAADRAAEL
jgi:pyrroline-5-carboxylate reductase